MPYHQIEVGIVVNTGAQTGVVISELLLRYLKHKSISSQTKQKQNSVAFSPQANYTD
jgi:hypothetical protein